MQVLSFNTETLSDDVITDPMIVECMSQIRAAGWDVSPHDMMQSIDWLSRFELSMCTGQELTMKNVASVLWSYAEKPYTGDTQSMELGTEIPF